MLSQTLNLKKAQYLLAALLLMCVSLMLMSSPLVHASGPFSSAFVRYDNLTAGSTTSGRVCFAPSSTGGGAMGIIVVTFPTNTNPYTLAAAASWTFNTTNLQTGQTAVTNLPTHPTISGLVMTVTLTSTQTISNGNTYCFNFNSELTLPTAGGSETAAGSVTSETSGAAVLNTTNFSYSNAIITSNTVVVNAVVPPSFTLALSGNTDTFASNLSTGSINATPGNTITLTTNAATGYNLWAEDSNYKTVTDTGSNPANEHGALKSTVAAYAIANATSNSLSAASHLFVAGSEDYGLQVANTTAGTGYGTTTINADYINTTANYAGTPNPTFFQPIASDSGTANGNVLTVKELATISGNTPAAGDYTDTISYTGAGSF